MRPLLLDLYCCAGGAAMGYHRAGFDVIGVDKVDRPRYPFPFVQADALDVLDAMKSGNGAFTWNLRPGHITTIRPDAVHASPPCQADNPLMKGTNGANGWGRDHTSLTAATRAGLDELGIPYVIEQPTGSGELRRDLLLCMDMWPKEPPRVWRHREFELRGFTVPQPVHPKHSGRVRGWRHGVKHAGDYVAAYGSGGGKATIEEMQDAMGIPWTNRREELTEAVPPAYTEYIGRHLLLHL